MHGASPEVPDRDIQTPQANGRRFRHLQTPTLVLPVGRGRCTVGVDRITVIGRTRKDLLV